MPLHLTVFQDKQDYLLLGSPAFRTAFIIIWVLIVHSNKPVSPSLTLSSFAAHTIGITFLLTEHSSPANTSHFHNRYRTNLPHYQIRQGQLLKNYLEVVIGPALRDRFVFCTYFLV